MADNQGTAQQFIVAVPPTGEPVSSTIIIVIDILGALAALLGLCGSWKSALQQLAQQTQQGFDNVGVILAWMGSYSEGLLKPLTSFFTWLWSAVIVSLLSKVLNALKSLHQWLEAKLGPMIQAIQQMNKALNSLFNTYIKPVLNVIQKARQFLMILRQLGVKWAGKLDARLLQLEVGITAIFLNVRSILNGASDILNSIADPLGLLRRPTLVLSLRRVANTCVRGFTGLPASFFLPTPPSTQQVRGNITQNYAVGDINSDSPLPSSYFTGDDGLGEFSGYTSGDVPSDSLADTMNPLDYFNPDLWPDAVCSDPVSCAQSWLESVVGSSPVQS